MTQLLAKRERASSRLNALLFLGLASTVAGIGLPAAAQSYSPVKTLYTFSGPDGQFPVAGVTLDGLGNLYGTTNLGGPAFSTLLGGSDGFGTIYKLLPSGQLTTLASFDGLDGFKPASRVAIDGQGNLWGATVQGGFDWDPTRGHMGQGTLWEYTAAGAFIPGTVEFAGPDGDTPAGNLTFDAQGDLVGATSNGGFNWNPSLGDFGLGTVFKLSNSLVLSNPASISRAEGSTPDAGVGVDSLGNIYGTLADGGSNGQGSIYEVSTTGLKTTLFSFNKANGSFPTSPVIIDSQGNLYGTTQQGGLYGFGTVWKYSPSAGLTTLVNFNGTNGQFPASGVVMDSHGNLFGSTVNGGSVGDGVIYEYSTSGVLSTVVDFTGANGQNPEDTVTFDNQGNLFGTTEDGGATGRGTIFEVQPATTTLSVSSVTVSPSTVSGGSTAQGTVTISGPAPTGGVLVTLGSPSSQVSPGGPVLIPAGATSASFTITTEPVTSNITVPVSASLGGGTQQASLSVTEPATTSLVSLAVDPDIIQGGNSSTGTVTLNELANAPTVVSLSSATPTELSVPSSVTVPAGSISAQFPITTQPVTSSVSVTITATLGTSSHQATPLITAPITTTVGAMSVNPPSVAGGTNVIGTVSLSRQASADTVVSLSSNSSVASVPASVTVPAGYDSADFTITTQNVTSATAPTVTASLNGSSVPVSVNIVPASSITLSQTLISPTTVTGGTTTQGLVQLSGPAPAGGAQITLSSNNSSVGVPAVASIPAGGTVTTFAITTQTVNANVNAAITATYAGVSQQAALTVTPVTPALAISSFTLNPTSIPGGSTSTGTVTLNGPAPSGGQAVEFSSNSSLAVPTASIVIPAGATSGTMTVTAASTTTTSTATINATMNSGSVAATLTITPGSAPSAALSSITLNPTRLRGGGSVTGTVTLTSAAPAGGAVVTLSSSNPSIAKTPSSVTVSAGSTSANFTITTTRPNNDTTVNITATYSGVTKSAVLTVTHS